VQLNDACLLEQIQEFSRGGGVSVLMGQMWANFISAEALQRVQAMGIITVNVSMDDRLPEHWETFRGVRLGSVGLGAGLDLVLTSSPEVCPYYWLEDIPAIFWPMASDPERFKPYPEHEKRYNVSFIGNKYGIRGRIISALQKAGIEVTAFGSGWPNGPADADQSAEIFGRSRIILGIGTVAYNEDIFTLKLRDFDAPMSGALYLTHRNPDLLPLYDEGREIECYASVDECIEKIRYYLQHPEARMKIGLAAAARARREHTWEKRLRTAFQAVGLLGDA
jgi:spore maturation protein CgeB